MFDYIWKPLDTSLFIYIHDVFTTHSLFCQEPRERIPIYIFSKILQRHFFSTWFHSITSSDKLQFHLWYHTSSYKTSFQDKLDNFYFSLLYSYFTSEILWILWITYSFRFRNLYLDFKHLFRNDLGLLSLPWEWFWLVFFFVFILYVFIFGLWNEHRTETSTKIMIGYQFL